jgi:hypothetical protein
MTLVVLVAAALTGCGGSSKPPAPSPLAGRMADWSDAARTYGSTLSHCARQPRPGKGYWSDCTGADRRAYEEARTRVLAAAAGERSSDERRCSRDATRARALVDELTGALERFWRANDSLLAGAARGEHYSGPPIVPLEARTARATNRVTGEADRLAKAVGRDC